MRWLTTDPFVAFDTETTGVDVEQDRIVSACVVRAAPDPGGARWTLSPSTWLINPGVEIPTAASDIHGITTERARTHGEDPPAALERLAGLLIGWVEEQVPVAGFNLAFDLTILDRDLRRNGMAGLSDRLGGRALAPMVDVYVIDKHVDQFRKGSRRLDAVCTHYGAKLDLAHDAGADAVASARVAYRIAQMAVVGDRLIRQTAPWWPALTRYQGSEEVADKYRSLMEAGPLALHAMQMEWRVDQQASLKKYLTEQGRDASDVNGQWPMVDGKPAPPASSEVKEESEKTE